MSMLADSKLEAAKKKLKKYQMKKMVGDEDKVQKPVEMPSDESQVAENAVVADAAPTQETAETEYTLQEWKDWSDMQQQEIARLQQQIVDLNLSHDSNFIKLKEENNILSQEKQKLVKISGDLEQKIKKLQDPGKDDAKVTILQLSERSNLLQEENVALMHRLDKTRLDQSQFIRREDSLNDRIKELENLLLEKAESSKAKVAQLEAEITRLTNLAADMEDQLSITRAATSQKIGELENVLKLSKSKFIHRGINTAQIDVLDTATSPIAENKENAATQAVETKSPIISPGERSMRKKSHDARATATGREQELLSQLSALTGKLLDLESQNQALTTKISNEKDLSPTIIQLQSQIAQLKNELDKERKVVVLLQGKLLLRRLAEVDTLPDMIELYHKERKALLKRINSTNLQIPLSEKSRKENAEVFEIPCSMCKNNPTVEF